MKHDLSPQETALVLDVVQATQPDETELAQELLRPPSRWVTFHRNSGPAGFGAEAVVDLVAPYAIVVGAWAFGVVHGEAKAILDEKLKFWTRKVLGRHVEPPQTAGRATESLSMDELEQEIARLAGDLNMKPEKARVLAAAIVSRIQKGQA
ncbi:hypothetical protein [uncultured Modestobacter sp.]|uniref:hypothetical protein n=1 Tax=uncultured Modestobacter sp. TaxID=380048 RepID=UPI0026017962|nr:hypothetical protein [uncultured Modestobacter sp.]